ncbi:MAG: hypothetical protein RR067_05290 [Bacilli bacterium]
MASINIHYAIGKRYIEKNNITDKESFLKGVIEPDLKKNKDKSHYSNKGEYLLFLDFAKNKVILPKFLNKNDITSDYKKGIFLHLLTDYLFFNHYFPEKITKNVLKEDFLNDLYFSYYENNDYLIDKYNINFGKLEKKVNKNLEVFKKRRYNNLSIQGKNILDNQELNKFIEDTSSINLEDYKEKIITNNCNVLP